MNPIVPLQIIAERPAQISVWLLGGVAVHNREFCLCNPTRGTGSTDGPVGVIATIRADPHDLATVVSDRHRTRAIAAGCARVAFRLDLRAPPLSRTLRGDGLGWLSAPFRATWFSCRALPSSGVSDPATRVLPPMRLPLVGGRTVGEDAPEREDEM